MIADCGRQRELTGQGKGWHHYSCVSPVAKECMTIVDPIVSQVTSVSIEYTWKERMNHSLICLWA